jgi:hypothetical protein
MVLLGTIASSKMYALRQKAAEAAFAPVLLAMQVEAATAANQPPPTNHRRQPSPTTN